MQMLTVTPMATKAMSLQGRMLVLQLSDIGMALAHGPKKLLEVRLQHL